jgi:uncharacterized protein YcaQ
LSHVADTTVRLTADQARRVMVAAQGLDRRPSRKARKEDVLAGIRRMSVLQIDTIHVVERSPYLVLWSRLGPYRQQWLDELLEEGRLFEYWAHEASFIPIEDYGLFRHRMIDPGGLGWKYSHEWIEQHADVVEHVLETIRRDGPKRSADFRKARKTGGNGWWNWKPEKRALEMLFTAGRLMVAKRDRFQRIYDIRERVHDEWDDSRLPSIEDAHAGLVTRAAAALGVATSRWLADYYRMSRVDTEQALERLLARGAVREVSVDGWPAVAFMPAEGLGELIAAVRRGGLRATHTTLISPFDPIVWDRSRAAQVFDFEYRLECYVPAPKRRWGYFVLPILRHGRIVGRLDAKAHRADARFEVRALYLEDGVRPDERFTRDIARAIAECADWHGTPGVLVRRTEPASFARPLRAAIRDS